MKHLLLNIIIFVGCTSNLFAQFNIGVKAGLSVSSVNFSGIEVPSNYRLGMSIGIPISYDISKRVMVGVNTDFIQKGYNLEFNGQANYTQSKYNYLQITPNIDFLVIKDLHLGFGLYYAIKTGEFQKVGKDEWIDTEKFRIIKHNDFGISPSIGYSYKNLLFQLIYQYGIRNIANVNFTDSDGEIIPNVKGHNRVFEMGLIYRFRLKGKTDDNKL